MKTARKEDGVALVAAIVLLTIILGLGLALLMFGDGQQRAAAREQYSERAFAIAEAALNAQVGQLSRIWPSAINPGIDVARCTNETSTNTNYCPAKAPLEAAYGKTSGRTCPAGTRGDAWGAPLTTPWATYVRSAERNSKYFESQVEQNMPEFAKNEEGKLWVRAVGMDNCRVVSLVTLVSRQVVSVTFPKDVLGGNWFETTNNGNKTIVEANWKGEAGEVGMRCEGFTTREPGAAGSCVKFETKSKGPQINPYNPAATPPPSEILSQEEAEAVRSLAESNGTLHSAALGNCPTTVAQLAGSPAYVENCGNIKIAGHETANTATSPGFLLLANGSIAFTGGGTYYGVIYARNPTNTSEALVKLGGSITVQGGIDVDGAAGIALGSNQVNVEFNPEAAVKLQGSAGVTPTRNTFRVLPISQ